MEMVVKGGVLGCGTIEMMGWSRARKRRKVRFCWLHEERWRER